eukprot:1157595-Pelagomonas_calceolata.AAC.1
MPCFVRPPPLLFIQSLCPSNPSSSASFSLATPCFVRPAQLMWCWLAMQALHRVQSSGLPKTDAYPLTLEPTAKAGAAARARAPPLTLEAAAQDCQPQQQPQQPQLKPHTPSATATAKAHAPPLTLEATDQGCQQQQQPQPHPHPPSATAAVGRPEKSVLSSAHSRGLSNFGRSRRLSEQGAQKAGSSAMLERTASEEASAAGGLEMLEGAASGAASGVASRAGGSASWTLSDAGRSSLRSSLRSRRSSDAALSSLSFPAPRLSHQAGGKLGIGSYNTALINTTSNQKARQSLDAGAPGIERVRNMEVQRSRLSLDAGAPGLERFRNVEVQRTRQSLDASSLGLERQQQQQQQELQHVKGPRICLPMPFSDSNLLRYLFD